MSEMKGKKIFKSHRNSRQEGLHFSFYEGNIMEWKYFGFIPYTHTHKHALVLVSSTSTHPLLLRISSNSTNSNPSIFLTHETSRLKFLKMNLKQSLIMTTDRLHLWLFFSTFWWKLIPFGSLNWTAIEFQIHFLINVLTCNFLFQLWINTLSFQQAVIWWKIREKGFHRYLLLQIETNCGF